jgi:hypothetical protein
MRTGTWKTLWLSKRECAVLLAYLGTVLLALSRYEPWEDEGRAWMIVRSFGLWDMLVHILRYEDHPALWYLILYLPVHLHIPFVGINGISIAIGFLGVWMLLRYAPFPFWLRAMLPFGFWLGYQYSVVARDYVLFPVLGFTAAHLFRRATPQPVWMAIILGLLANSSVYGTLAGTGLALAYGWKVLEKRGTGDWSPQLARQATYAIAIFVCSLLFVTLCLWPPKDLHSPLSPAVRKSLSRVMPVRYDLQPANSGENLHSGRSLQDDLPPGARVRTRLQIVFDYPVAGFWGLSVAIEGTVIFLLIRRRLSVLLLPFVFLSGFMATIYSRLCHTGMVWVMLIVLVWIAWDHTSTFRWRSLQGATSLLLAMASIVQISWTIKAIHYEMGHMTYPAEATAKYLKTLPRSITVDGNGYAFMLLPYFDHNLFTAYNVARYEHHGLYPANETMEQMVAYAPDVIVLRKAVPGQPNGDEEMQLETSGYRQTHEFCGISYFPNRTLFPLCLLTYERKVPTR